MIQSESEFTQLTVEYIDGQQSDGLLLMIGGLMYGLRLRADLDPEAAVIIQMDAAQIVKEERSRLQDGELKGKMWRNGKWSDYNLDLFNKDSHHWEVVLKVTDRHLD